MIAIDLKAESSVSSSNKRSKADEKTSLLSFSELLKGIDSKTDGSSNKMIHNGSLILALNEQESTKANLDTKVAQTQSTKQDSFSSLLKIEEVEINPTITNSLSIKEIKQLIVEAKQYLKSKISELQEYKELKSQDLPKTLKGLATLAKKLHIDVSKITIEDVQVVQKDTPKLTTTTPQRVKTDDKVKLDEEKSVKDFKPSKQSDRIVADEEPLHVKTTLVKKSKEIHNEVVQEQVQKIEAQEDKKQLKEGKIASLKTTSLFKAQKTQEITTEQLVQAKQIQVEQKTPKQKADETLQLLLKGEKASKGDLKLTADFSVATARVIAPSATKESTKNLETLLKGEHSQGEDVTKLESTATHKAESLEVKIKESKQMIHYLSKDVKTAIEDYKAPFTRVKVQLNPQNLGSVELTVVQRGKNLHVNLSSNNAAINALAMNANDLKTQLNNSGINNATLNFSNSSQDGSNAQQHNPRQGEQAHKEYNHFNKEEQNEEILNSLEIVVPHYA